jgi:hypothetical protein
MITWYVIDAVLAPSYVTPHRATLVLPTGLCGSWMLIDKVLMKEAAWAGKKYKRHHVLPPDDLKKVSL